MSTTMRWVGLALLGVAIAVGVSIAASGLVSQQIGLASEPITAGDALAPQAAAVAVKRDQGKGRKTPPKKTPTSHTLPPATTPTTGTTEAQPPVTEPEPEPPVESNPPGGEGDHGGSGGSGADD